MTVTICHFNSMVNFLFEIEFLFHTFILTNTN